MESTLTAPVVPRRNSSVSQRSRERTTPGPPSPDISTSIGSLRLPSPDKKQIPLPRPPIIDIAVPPKRRVSLAASSDGSDYGSDADANEDYNEATTSYTASKSCSADNALDMNGDYANAMQLTGSPPKVERPHRLRGPLPARAPGGLATPVQTSRAPTHAMADPLDSILEPRSLSPRKPRLEPSLKSQSSISELRRSMEARTMPRSSSPERMSIDEEGRQDEDSPKPQTHHIRDVEPLTSPGLDEAALEAAATKAADLEDPNRPRTLKEARELAKARALARDQRAEGGRDGNGSASTSRTGSPKVNVGTPAGSTFNSPALDQNSTSAAAPTALHNSQTIEELQAAVGDAMEDLSFESGGSAASDTGTLPLDAGKPQLRITALSPPSVSDLSMKGEAVSHSGLGIPASDSSKTITTFGGGRYADAEEEEEEGRPASAEEQKSLKGASRNQGGTRTGDASLFQAPAPSAPPSPLLPQTPTQSSQRGETLTTAQLQQQARAGPSLLPRLDPVVPSPFGTELSPLTPTTRLGIPGRTVPFPPAFNAETISVQKRKLPPWERARTYAEFINELSSTPSGLILWMEAAQRRTTQGSASRLPSFFSRGSAPDGTVSGLGLDAASAGYHPRDVSGSSTRSDMTFPIRGDGGKARDVTQIPLDQSQPDAMPGAVPANIPYPHLVHDSSSRSLSSTSAGLATPPGSTGRTGGLRARKMSSNALDAINPFSGGSTAMASSLSSSPIRERHSAQFGNVPPAHFLSAPGHTPEMQRPPPSSSRTSLFGALGRRNSKRSVHPSVPPLSSTPSSGSLSGPRGPRLPGAAGALGRAIGYGYGARSNSTNTTTSANSASPSLAGAGSSFGSIGSSAGRLVSGAGGYNISQPIATSSTTMVDLDGAGRRSEQAGLGLGLTRSVESGESSEFENSLGSANGAQSPGYFAAGSGQTEPSTPTAPRASPFGQRGQAQDGGALGPSHSLRQTTSMSTIQANSPTTAGPVPALPPRPGQGDAGPKNDDANNNDPEFSRALSRLADVLPDVDEDILIGYLRRAGGKDGDEVRAIGEYLGDKAAGRIKPGTARR